MSLFLGRLAIISGLLIAIATATIDKNYSYELGFDWQEEKTENNEIIGWRVLDSHTSEIKTNSLLTHVRIGDIWQPINSLVLLPILNSSTTNLTQLKKALRTEQAFYSQRHQSLDFKNSNQDIFTTKLMPASWSSLGFDFWLYLSLCLFSFMLAWWALHWQRIPIASSSTDQRSTRGRLLLVLLFVGAGLTLALPNTVADRVWAMPVEHFWWRFVALVCVVKLNALAILRLSMSLPVALIKRHIFWRIFWYGLCVLYITSVVLLLVEQSYAIEYLQLTSALLPLLSLTILSAQWWATRPKTTRLVDKIGVRSVIRFNLFLIVFFSLFYWVTNTYFVSIAYAPNLILWFGSLCANLVLFILVFRHHLYKITHWSWLIYPLLTGVVVFFCVLTYTSNFGLNHKPKDLLLSSLVALSTALSLVFWLQYRFIRSNNKMLSNSGEQIQAISKAISDSKEFWQNQKALFKEALQSQEADIVAVSSTQTELLEGGEAMQFSVLDNKGIRLSAPDRGKRLFNELDVKIINMLRDLATQKEREKQAFAKGEKHNHQQIAQDLNSDIAERLQKIANEKTDDSSSYAQKTLQQLQGLTQALGQPEQTLERVLNNQRSDALERAKQNNIQLFFELSIKPDCKTLLVPTMALAQINAMLNELFDNAFKHEWVCCIEAKIHVSKNQTLIHINNDGTKTSIDEWVMGVGCESIKQRLQQLGGSVQWRENPTGGVTVNIEFNTLNWLAL